MREEEPNSLGRWEEELPVVEELTPLTQTLITPDLALAFDIPTSPRSPSAISLHSSLRRPPDDRQPQPSTHHQSQPLQPEFDLTELRGGGGGGGGGGGDESARTLRRPRLVWTPQLHKRFVDAVAQLGIKNAVPKTIMQLMNVEGLTRENVASHLQKYRLYLKRVQGQQGLSGMGAGGAVSVADAAADSLFASTPVPHHFLSHAAVVARGGVAGGGAPDHFTPQFMLQHPQRTAAVTAATAHQEKQHYYHQGYMGHIIGSPASGGVDHGYLTRQQQQQQQPGTQRLVGQGGNGVLTSPSAGLRADDLERDAGAKGGGRKELTLFPTAGED